MIRRSAVLVLALAAGLGLGYAAIRKAGTAEVAESLARLGWQGFLAMCLLQCAVVAVRAAALSVQVGPATLEHRPGYDIQDGAPGSRSRIGFFRKPVAAFRADALAACLGARLARDGAQNVLWMVPGLGVVAGIRSLGLILNPVQAGSAAIGPVRAAACTFIDMLIESLTLMACALLSLLLVARAVESGHGGLWLAAFAAAAAPLAGLALFARHAGARRGLGKLVRRGARAFGRGVGRDLTDATAVLYADRPRMRRGVLLHLAGWLLGAGQIWLAARAMGVDLPLPAALALNSLVVAVTGLLFVVPWGAGVQEASFVLVGGLFGVDPATALVLSLALRARDLAFGLPGVVLWSVLEARRRWGRVETRLPDPVA